MLRTRTRSNGTMEGGGDAVDVAAAAAAMPLVNDNYDCDDGGCEGALQYCVGNILMG